MSSTRSLCAAKTSNGCGPSEPDLEVARSIVEQMAKGLRAFHPQEMLHQDLRPENILIDGAGSIKLIDFGSVRVVGLAELHRTFDQDGAPGTLQYAAPEYFLGEAGSVRSDLCSLGVITYQPLSGSLHSPAHALRVPATIPTVGILGLRRKHSFFHPDCGSDAAKANVVASLWGS